jgi:hypothetical protein
MGFVQGDTGGSANAFKFKLTAHIDVPNAVTKFVPYFSAAQFKGNGYEVKDFSWNKATSNVGFLGFVNRSTVSQLKVYSTAFESSGDYNAVSGQFYVGTAIGSLHNGVVYDSFAVLGGTTRGLDNTGGFMGYFSDGTVADVSATRLGSITDPTRAKVIGSMNYDVDGDQWQHLRGNTGGVAGYMGGVSAINLSSNLQIHGGGYRTGGLIGYLSINGQSNAATPTVTTNTATNLSASGNVSAGGQLTGGLIGYVSGPGGSVASNNWTSSGNVSQYGGKAGGLIGEAYNVNISNANSTAATVTSTGGAGIGGLIGYSSYLTLTNGSTIANVQGNESTVGGFVGNHHGTLTNVTATGHVIGRYNNLGGLIGYSRDTSTVTNASATGNVSAIDYVSYGDYVGGLIGNSRGTTVTDAIATGNVIGRHYVGGLIGYQERNITHARATGTVNTTGGVLVDPSGTNTTTEGGDFVGGLVGRQESYTVKNASYIGASVTGRGYVGGLIGLYNGPGSNASNAVQGSYATTNITASKAVPAKA